eukprot:6716387-Pyramimonas_sp.AAC.1
MGPPASSPRSALTPSVHGAPEAKAGNAASVVTGAPSASGMDSSTALEVDETMSKLRFEGYWIAFLGEQQHLSNVGPWSKVIPEVGARCSVVQGRFSVCPGPSRHPGVPPGPDMHCYPGGPTNSSLHHRLEGF